MNDDWNQYQIIRIDARNCFVESLSDAFSIGKAHLTFCSYDKRRPTGQRMTDSIQIYIDMPDWLELCRMLDSGELRWLLQQSLKSGDRSPIREWLGGTSAKKLARFGKPRADGKSLSRTAQLLPGSKTDSLLFVANSGPGEEVASDDQGSLYCVAFSLVCCQTERVRGSFAWQSPSLSAFKCHTV